MRAASRAGVTLVVALGLLGPLTAAAQPASVPAGPRCPAIVGDQPLLVTAPFSATVRRRADDQGQIESMSLRCAYGEGAAPAAEVTVTWAAGRPPCAATEVEVATGLDPAPFDRVAADLAASAGQACSGSSASGWRRTAVAAGLITGAGLTLLGLRRRRASASPSA